jgi:peroxiredoxin
MKPAWRNTLIVVALAALTAGYFVSRWISQPPLEKASSVLVDFSLPDLNGKNRWLSEWQGRVIVLNFWATWCEPCRDEIPLLVKLQKRYQKQNVQLVGVAIDTREAVADYAGEMHINYPLLLGAEAELSIMAQYGNSRGFLPYTVVIGPDGVIVARKLGAFRGKELETLVDSLVNLDSATTIRK